MPFGTLFDDDEVANYYEALVGTLKAAKKRKIIDFPGQLLLKGQHDKVEIKLLPPAQSAGHLAALGMEPEPQRSTLQAASKTVASFQRA